MVTTRIKKYFIYPDKLRRIVSIVTGILIAFYNAFSGIMIVHIIGELLFGVHSPDFRVWLLYIIPGMITGAGVLRLCIVFVDLMQRGIEIEKYSYLRLVLLVSVVSYLLILIIYSLIAVSTVIGSV